jgi:hypothetical protein
MVPGSLQHLALGRGRYCCCKRDGKISRLLNLGVLVVPDKTMPTYTVQAQQHELAVNRHGIHESRVNYGGYKRALDVSGPMLHDRFNRTATPRLQNIAKTSADAPLSWGHRIASNESKARDACLRAKATRPHLQQEMPKTYKPGDNVSSNIFTSEVPHRAGGEKYVMGFTDSFSSRKKLYLLHNKSDASEALDMYVNWCKSKGVIVNRLHMNNAPEFGEHSEPMQRVLKAHNLYGAMTTCAPYTPNQNGAMSGFLVAKGNKVVDACIAIVEAGLDHEVGFWIENTTSLGDGSACAPAW